jgi:4-amino-4-deoxy-L-arabinose transferase-like glycosyltransferase
MDIKQLSTNSKFWAFTILGVLAYSLLFVMTNSINNLDELHYLSLAFEMHKQHYYLLPVTLGHPDIQKPPLLYWLINLGWSVFGYTTTWPLMLIALINIGCLLTTWRIAQKLFPEKLLVAQLAVVVLATGVFWFHFFNRIRFDGLITLFTAMYINFAINIYRERKFKWTLLAGICMGLGFLAKGVAILVFALPFYLLLPRYESDSYAYAKWLGHFVLTLLIALVIVACWAVPLYLSLGRALIDTMFVKQQHSRVLLSHHLGEMPTLLVSFMPWTILPILLFNLKRVVKGGINKHFWLLGWTVLLSGLFFTFLVLMHVKRYLLPLYPYAAILLAYIISLNINAKILSIQNRVLSLACGIVGTALVIIGLVPIAKLNAVLPPSYDYAIWGAVLIAVAICAYFLNKLPTIQNKLVVLIGIIISGLMVGIIGINGIFTRTNDVFLEKMALQMKANQDRNIPQANLISGGYQAFDFKGHLRQPLPLFDENSRAFKHWLQTHPNGILYFSSRKHVRSCMTTNSFYLKGSDRIISIISVKNYLESC